MSDSRRSTTWRPRPWLARGIRLLVFLAPIAVSLFVVRALSQSVDTPGSLAPRIAWWTVVSFCGTVVLYTTELLFRRLSPLSTLLRLTLVFPDRAPKRFSVALRTGTPKQLARRLEDAREHGLGDTPQEAAEHLLELVALLNEHDRLTRGHCERVRAYTDLIAQEMGLDEFSRSKLHWAGMIHDIGKLDVPAEILSKPSKLTDEEFAVIKRHPEAGARLAAPLADWLGEWFHAIDQHHERWDGRGYPYGLAGSNISLAGRIVAVADVFDVITAARSYKKPRPAVEAREELARCAGSHFDPAVVRAFLGVSLGRIRLMLGPLARLGDLPLVGRVPAGPGVSSAIGGAVAASAVVLGGFFAHEPPTSATAAASRVDAVEEEAAAAPVSNLPTPTTSQPPAPIVADPVAPAAARSAAPEEPPAPVSAPKVVGIALQIEDDTFMAVEDSSIVLDVLANDQGDELRITVVHAPAGVMASLAGDRIDFRPPPDANGVMALSYEVADANGSTDSAEIRLVVLPLNDAPRFDLAGNVASAEDDGAAVIPAFAQNASPGPADEASQTVTFTATVDDPVLLSAGPTIDATGALHYTPAPDANGTTTLRITATDSLGATSTERTATLTITAVNDAPTLTAGTDIAEDSGAAGAHTIAGWVTSIAPGPADEGPQTVSFVATADDPALFAVAPSIDATGTLAFTLASHAHGTTTLHVTAVDSIGASSGEQTAAITISAVNDPPIAAEDAYLSTGGPITFPISTLLENDSDDDGDPLIVVSVAASASSGVALVSNDGTTVTYDPNGHTGVDEVLYTITDSTTTVVGAIHITVDPIVSPQSYYLTAGPAASNVWSLVNSWPPGSGAPDVDGDGSPGLTIKKSGGKHDESDPLKVQDFVLAPTSTVTLNGPVVLDLWSTAAGFDPNDDAHINTYLERCNSDGTNCTMLVANDVHVSHWNDGVSNWVLRSFNLGSVNTTIAPTEMLRLRVLFEHDDVWIALSDTYRSSLELPVAGP